MKMSEIQQLTNFYANGTQMLVDNICAAIMELPPNPKATPIAESPRCFTVQFSDLGDNWTPFFHDFRSQYELLIKIIRKTPVANIVDRLGEILETSSYRDTTANYTYKFHPDVIQNLANMLGVEMENDSEHSNAVV